MRKSSLSEAAAMLGRKGGKVGGRSKARTGISERMKAWWASGAAAHRRKNNKMKVDYGEQTYCQLQRPCCETTWSDAEED
jgi:hypothetical protein